MKIKSIIAASAIAFSTVTVTNIPSQGETNRFFCATDRENVPTTFYLNATGRKIPLISWKKDWGGGLTKEARCDIVSLRFQQAHQRRVLIKLTYGIENGYRVICATRDYGGACEQELFTLRPGDKPDKVIEELLNAPKAGSPVVQDNGTVQHYYSMDELMESLDKR